MIVTRLPRNAWTPQLIGPRLRAWHDAADVVTVSRTTGTNNLTGLRDKSTLHGALVAGGTNPRWGQRRFNGLPVMSFDGNNSEYVSSTVTGTNPYSVIPSGRGFIACFVAFPETWVDGGSVDGTGTYFVDRDSTSGSGNPLWSFKMSGGSNYMSVQRRSDSGTNIGSDVLYQLTSGVPFIMCARYCDYTLDVDGYGLRAWANGLLCRVLSANYGGISPDAVRFGYSANAGSASFNSVGEYIFCADAFDNKLRQRIEGYLSWKWGVRLTTSHPYAQRAPTVGPITTPYRSALYSSGSLYATALKMV